MGSTELDWMPSELDEVCRAMTCEVCDWRHMEDDPLCSCVRDPMVPALWM